MAEGERHSRVDATNLDDDNGNIDVISSMTESYFPPISSPQMNVNGLRRRKKSSSEADPIGVPSPDGLLLQEEEDGEIDLNDSLEKFLATIFRDYDNEEEDNNRIEETAEGENLFRSISPQKNFIFGSGVTSSKPLGIGIQSRAPIRSTESGLGFVNTGVATRRIRLLSSVTGNPIEPNESSIDPEAVQSSTDDLDLCKEAPSLTGLSSQSRNVKGSHIAEANKYLDWLFILTNLVHEILLVVLDQIACPQKPQYALTASALSLVAIAVSVIELSFKARQQEVTLIRQGIRFWFQYPSSTHKPFYNFIDVFGFICALCQFIFSAVAYSYHSRHADNPINISIVSLMFIICLASSKLTKDSKETPVSATV